MKIDIAEYILNDIGDTSWYGETYHDNESLDNLDKLNNYLYEIEELREELKSKLTDHITYRKGNASAEALHSKAKDIMRRHIIKEFTHTDFDNWFEGQE